MQPRSMVWHWLVEKKKQGLRQNWPLVLWWRSRRWNALWVSLAALVHFLVFIPLHDHYGPGLVVLAALPSALAGLSFGLSGALLVCAVILPLSLLLEASGAGPVSSPLQPQDLLGLGIALGAGLFTGLMAEVVAILNGSSANKAQLAAILENTTDLVAMSRQDGRLLYINQAGRRMLGLEPDGDLNGLRVENFHPPGTVQTFHAVMLPQAIREGSWSGETIFCSLQGEIFVTSQVILAHRSVWGRVEFLSTIARNISERKQAEEAEREQRILAEALRDTAAALTSTLDFEAVLDRILESVERVVPHEMAIILLVENDVAHIVRRRSSTGQTERSLPDGLPIRETPSLHTLVTSGLPLVVPDTRTYTGWRTYPESEWVRSYLSAPILIQGEVIGLLTLFSSTPNFYHPGQTARLSAFANQAAIALQNARLHTEAERRAAQFQALYALAGEVASYGDLHTLLATLVERAADLLNTPGGALFLYNEERGELQLAVIQGGQGPLGQRVPLGSGLSGRVAQARQPMRVHDYLHWEGRISENLLNLHAAVAVPLLYRNTLLGVLLVFETSHPRDFTQAETDLLTLFAGQAASALHNTRLFDETRRRLFELETINTLSSGLTAAETTEAMLPLLVNEAMKVVQGEAGAIWLLDPEDNNLYPAITRGWFGRFQGRRIQPGDCLIGTAFKQGQVLSIPDLAADPRWCPGIQSLVPPGWAGVLAPIRTNRATIGVLCVSTGVSPLPSEAAHLLALLAEMGGSALQRASLHQQTQVHLKRLSALHAIDMTINASLDLATIFEVLLNQAMAQLKVDAVAIFRLLPATQDLELTAGRGFLSDTASDLLLELARSLAGQVLHDRRLILVPDLQDQHSEFRRAPQLAGEKFVSYCGIPLIAKGWAKGVLEVFSRSPLRPDAEWLGFLETLAGQAAIAFENSSLFEDLQRSNLELVQAYDATIAGWSRALDLRDKETEGHTQRVTEMSLRLAEAMGLGEAELVQMRRGALLHDIGKMAIPDGILLKPGPLTPEEQQIMNLHPVHAYNLLASISFLRPALDVPYCHHEHWDGSGYPRGLKGEQIPLPARLFAVVDVWDALCSDRPYRPAWKADEVLAYLRQQAGKIFDPRAVEAFLQILDGVNSSGAQDNPRA